MPVELHRSFDIIPVMDLIGGHVVRAAGGDRRYYRPITDSRLVRTSRPAEMAAAVRDQLACKSVYLADLDAIESRPSHGDVYRDIRDAGLQLWLDAGVRSATDAQQGRDRGADVVVAGLETLPSPRALADGLAAIGSDAFCFSLDLRDARPMASGAEWQGMDALGVGRTALAIGVRRIIVLDLTRVGADAGVGTHALCHSLLHDQPDLSLYVGGGIRTIDDLLALRDAGIAGALVSTALHDGRIGRAEIERLAGRSLDQSADHS